MNILLIDDEPEVLQGVEFIVHKYRPQYKIIGKLQNPDTALSVIAEHSADLVIADVKMPGITGIELVGLIRESFPQVFVVLLSAYSDFEYVQKGMKNGAFDYLLKPSSYTSILDTLDRVYESCKERRFRFEREQELENIRFLIKHDVGTAVDAFAARAASMVVCRREYDQSVEHSLRRDNDRLFKDAESDAIYYLSMDSNYIFLICSPDNNRLLSVLTDIGYDFNKSGGFMYWTLLPDMRSFGTSLNKAYSYCNQILSFMQFNELPGMILPEEYERRAALSGELQLALYLDQNRLGDAIQRDSDSVIRAMIVEGFGALRKDFPDIDPVKLKGKLFNLLLELEKTLGEYGFLSYDEILQNINFDLYHQLDRMRSYQTLVTWVTNFLLAISEGQVNILRYPKYICDAVRYIKKNYSKKIMLNDIAHEVFMNSWYLSTQFKKIFGCSLSEYVNKVRIDQAKILLKQQNIMIYQVAEMVGFQEPSYFNSVFKKLEGISASEYQKKQLL